MLAVCCAWCQSRAGPCCGPACLTHLACTLNSHVLSVSVPVSAPCCLSIAGSSCDSTGLPAPSLPCTGRGVDAHFASTSSDVGPCRRQAPTARVHADTEPHSGWSGSCNVLLQNLLRDMRTPLQQEATISLLDCMSSRCAFRPPPPAHLTRPYQAPLTQMPPSGICVPPLMHVASGHDACSTDPAGRADWRRARRINHTVHA